MKLPAPEASSFALGQVLFENRSVNSKRRRAAHASVECKLELGYRNVCKNIIPSSTRTLETANISSLGNEA